MAIIPFLEPIENDPQKEECEEDNRHYGGDDVVAPVFGLVEVIILGVFGGVVGGEVVGVDQVLVGLPERIGREWRGVWTAAEVGEFFYARVEVGEAAS